MLPYTYRLELFERKWLPYLKKLPKQIPLSLGYVGANVLSLLTDDALIAQWNNEGLPSDNMSTENATILTNSVKWPLMIDPQLQGIKWIKNRFADKLTVIRLGQKAYLDTIEHCVSQVRRRRLFRPSKNMYTPWSKPPTYAYVCS